MTLTLSGAVDLLCWLTAISLLIQSAEYFRLCMAGARASTVPPSLALAPWPWSIQRDDLASSPRRVRSLFDALYHPSVHRTHLLIHALLAASLPLSGPTVSTALGLVVSQVLISIRWRGAFNGGSDFMTLAVISGIALGSIATPFLGPTLAWQAGLWLITIHALNSYFLSGAVKLRNASWRDGRALTTLLNGGLYGPLSPESPLRRRPVAVLCSWAFILWEISFPLAMIDPRITLLWCGLGIVFHFLVFWYFGLNRFFWAWCATFPALVGCAGLMGS